FLLPVGRRLWQRHSTARCGQRRRGCLRRVRVPGTAGLLRDPAGRLRLPLEARRPRMGAQPERTTMTGLAPRFDDGFVITGLETAINWARESSLWPMT